MGFLQNPNINSGSTSGVTSVNGKTGMVSLAKSDVGLENVTNDTQVKCSECGVPGGVETLDLSGKLTHMPTKSDIGLSNVTNDSQIKRSEMGIANGVETLTSGGKLTHMPTASDVGLGNVTNDAQVPLSQKGVANGVALLNANVKIIEEELPIATTSNVGAVKVGNGIDIDTSGKISPKLGTGLKLSDTYSVVLDPENIDVTQLKNFATIVTGSPKGFFDNTATLADFSSCVKGDFCVYNGESSFSLGGYTFNPGDQLWCILATSSTPENLTNNFEHVVESTAQATTTTFGTVKLGSTTPLMNTTTASVGTSVAMSREDHVHPSDTSKVSTTTTVNGHALSGNVSVTALDVGLGNVDNTSDTNKPISTAQAAVNAQKLNVVDSPTVIDWGPSIAVRAGEIRRCTTSQGTFTAGQVIRSKEARTTGTVFNSTEAEYWDQAGVGAGTATPLMSGTAAVGTGAKYAREDHRHPSDTSKAPIASPAFTGTPTAPTASTGTNTTQIATTSFVINQIPQPSYMRAYNGTAQTVSTTGTIVEFPLVSNSNGSDITLSSNCFLLKAGKPMNYPRLSDMRILAGLDGCNINGVRVKLVGLEQ